MELEETGYENVKWNEMAKDHYPVTDFDISSMEYFEFYYEFSLLLCNTASNKQNITLLYSQSIKLYLFQFYL
jgi:hypothetical protein